MLDASTIGGYVLEEVLARMIADSGYELLTSDSQDPVHLRRDKHGLLARGRGTDHQADALGDLLVPVPFSLPVRLFAEAKNRARKTGLDAVRNAVGVVTDVNQFQPPQGQLKLWRGDWTHHYCYSLFSTSGFTGPAQDFALAHQISLIDLSGPSFASLRKAVEIFASAVQSLAIRKKLETFPVGQMRAALRIELGTIGGQAAEADPSTGELALMPWSELQHLASRLAAFSDEGLVLGFPAGPQVLALRPDDTQAFREWAGAASGIVPMRLRYAPGRPDGEWIVLPASEPLDRRLALRFGTPPALAEWLFALEGETRRRLDKVKQGLLSSVTIYHSGRPIVLQLDVDAWWGSHADSLDVVLSQLKKERLDSSLAWEPDEIETAKEAGNWSLEAAGRYVDVLRQRDRSRLDVMLYAAAHGDWISRAHLYELMAFDPQRKMTGFTKPFEGVCRKLVEERLLDASTPNPVVPRYLERDGWALGVDLDRDFGRALRQQLPSLLDLATPER